jgi:hypothetical protein
MASAHRRSYDWPRFWVLPGTPNLDADGGFFPDPTTPSLFVARVPAVRLAECRGQRCLVLLAEPGLGKTRAIEDEVAADSDDRADRHDVRSVDLGAFDDARLLHAALFEHDAWRRWRDGDHLLELWLDSLDEALLHVRSVEKLLLYELQELGAERRGRLRLRVACRSADWSETFEQGLAELWPSEADATLRLQLAPLRRADALTAARTAGLDAEAFVGEIHDRGLTELAAQPLTLAMMLDAAHGQGALPETRAELYERGCRLLCQDPDPRRAPGEGLHPGQRLAVAQRLAAATLLAGRAALTTEPAGPPGREVRASEVAGGHERDPDASAAADFRVDVPQIEDTLRAALFTAAHGRVRFAHRALAEFLAAGWLAERRLSREQILSLLLAPGDEEGRLVPQLREVAAWTVALRPDLLGDLLRHEPDVLLRIERLDLAANDRSRIVAALLAVDDVAERVELFDRRTRRVLRSLDHRGLASQLRPVLRDRDAPWAVRQLAVTIAGACAVHELQDDLLALALDDAEADHLRALAIGALDEFADDEARRALLPLALEEQPSDSTDEIKGQALEAVCPRIVRAVEVLDGLTPPKDRNLIGSYRMFLRQIVPDALAVEDLPAALAWITEISADGPLASALAGLADAIIARAWQHLDRDGMPEALWAVLLPRLRADGELLSGDDRRDYAELFGDVAGRRRLLPLLAAEVRDGDLEPFWALHSTPPLVSSDDVAWLLDQVRVSDDPRTRAAFAALLAAAFVPEIPEREAVLSAASEDPELRAALSPWLDAVRLDSDHAKFRRERAERLQRAASPPDAPDMAKEIETHLARAEGGDLRGWWGLNYVLIFDEQGRPTTVGELEPDIRKLDGWQRMSDEQRSRALAVAKRYLTEAEPEPEQWFGTGTVWKPAFAGYRALYLLCAVDEASLAALPPATWARWAPIIVGYPLLNYSDDPLHDAIFQRGIATAPEDVGHWIERQIDADNERSGTLFGLRRLEQAMPSEILDVVAGKAQDPSLTPASRAALVELVLQHDHARGVEIAVSMLPREPPTPVPDDTPGSELIARVAAILLDRAGQQTWPHVAPILRKDHGVAVLERAVEDHRDIGADLGDVELAELVAILFELFPPEDDPPLRSGAFFMTSRHQLTRLRDGLLAVLAERGTDTAVSAIARLHDAHPDAHNIRFRWRDARDARRARWPAPAPGDIVRLAHTTDARIVMSAEHLQQLLVASLQRAGSALQGTPPRARELWNQKPLTPKDEGALSDWLQAWFNQDLLVGGRFVGRELQVRPSASGRGRGEDVDLVITATVGEHVQDAETVAVRIEVKGCWNRDLDTAMDDQLAARYLHPGSQRHGIYVVGAYDAPAWAAADRRRGACRRRRVLEDRDRFARQAAEVSAQRGVQVRAVVLDVRLPARDEDAATRPARAVGGAP